MKNTAIVVVSLLFLVISVACGSNDESAEIPELTISGSSYIDELSEGELQELCARQADMLGGGGSKHQCVADVPENDDDMLEVPSREQCLESPGLQAHCKVADMKTCYEGAKGNPCGMFESEACAAFNDCLDAQSVINPPPNGICSPKPIFCYCTTSIAGGYSAGKTAIDSCLRWIWCQPSACYGGGAEAKEAIVEYCNTNVKACKNCPSRQCMSWGMAF